MCLDTDGPAIELAGTELEIANAALKSGFDTDNHESLFDLIWAVKRLGLKIQKSANFRNGRPEFPKPAAKRPPKPFHPIYPDRYRPCGVGDNTQAKRKREHEDEQPPQFHPPKPLMRRKHVGRTFNPPNTPNSSKRRKMGDGEAVAGVSPTNKNVKELLDARSRFGNVRRTMNDSQADLKNWFDKHVHIFDGDELMRVLQQLATNLNACIDVASAGMQTTDRAVACLNSSRNVMIDDGVM